MKKGMLLKMLSGGDRRSIGRSEEAAGEVLANPLLFKELVRGMASEDPIVRMRAADAAEKVTAQDRQVLFQAPRRHPEGVGPQDHDPQDQDLAMSHTTMYDEPELAQWVSTLI